MLAFLNSPAGAWVLPIALIALAALTVDALHRIAAFARARRWRPGVAESADAIAHAVEAVYGRYAIAGPPVSGRAAYASLFDAVKAEALARSEALRTMAPSELAQKVESAIGRVAIVDPNASITQTTAVVPVEAAASPAQSLPAPPLSDIASIPPAPSTQEVAARAAAERAASAQPAPAPEPVTPAAPMLPVAWSATADVLARTIWGEAATEGLTGMEAVANVVVNRARHPRWWGHDVQSVCLAPKQFSCWNADALQHPRLLAVTATDPAFREAQRVAAEALMGTLPDHTNGADHYVNLSLAQPAWAKGKTPCAVIGKHTFFNLEIPGSQTEQVPPAPQPTADALMAAEEEALHAPAPPVTLSEPVPVHVS